MYQHRPIIVAGGLLNPVMPQFNQQAEVADPGTRQQVQGEEDGSGYSILMRAAMSNHLEGAKACITLAQAGHMEHHPDRRAPCGNTALMLALERCHTKMALYLVDSGSDLRVMNNKGETALAIACKFGCTAATSVILSRCTDSDDENTDYKDRPDIVGVTPLMHVARLGVQNLVQEFLSKNINLEAEDKDGVTALMAACQQGRGDVVNILLTAGADVNHRARDGNTALIYLTRHNLPATVKQLLDAGTDFNAFNNAGLNAVMQACRHGYPDILRLLITAGANLNHRLVQGQTALQFAIVRSVISPSPCLKQLLAAGVHIGSELQYATILGYTHIVQQFLEHGARPEQALSRHVFQAAGSRGIASLSPLASALITQRQRLAQLFIESGFLTKEDLKTLPNDEIFWAYLGERSKQQQLTLSRELTRPWPLKTLCMHAISCNVGFEPEARANNIKLSGLPLAFQRRLMYNLA